MPLTTEETHLLSYANTSLETLAEAGYAVERNDHHTFFRHRESRRVIPFPYWVTQLIDRARTDADAEAKRRLRVAMGIEDL